MPRRRNVITIHTDQQRADSLGCMGNPVCRTPNLDALAARGVLYRNHYTVNPVCMPSRAACITGRYPQANRVLDNGIPLPADQVTCPQVFRDAGYRTASFGKLHLQTFCGYEGDDSLESLDRWRAGELDGWTGPYYGYEEVGLAVIHGDRAGGGHYGSWRRRAYPDAEGGPRAGDADSGLCCYKSSVPLEAHHSTWITDRAIEYVRAHRDEPFLLNVSFPDPHHPFTPPAPYCDMYDGVDLPAPHAVEGEHETKPLLWREAMTGNPFPNDGGARHHPELSAEAYGRIVRHTYGMVTLIDDCVGRLLQALEAEGLAENTLIVFTSDHGDFLGDHHLIQKGQAPCRSLLQIPLIVFEPGAAPGVVEAVGSNVDVMPTLLDRCGIAIPETVQGVALPRPGEAPGRDYAYEAGWSKADARWHHHTLYTDRWRLSLYPNLSDGELYDLIEDPFEHVNRFHDAACVTVRAELAEQLAFAMGRAEPRKPPIRANW
ncbi:MAG: sulfatase [Planctomycetota bacterium]